MKEAASLKVKSLLYTCLLSARLPSGSRALNWRLETIYIRISVHCLHVWLCEVFHKVYKVHVRQIEIKHISSDTCSLSALPCSKYCITSTHWSIHVPSLVPKPHPAFHRLQYRKAGRAWYLFSREHDVISKLRKFAELTGCVLCIFNWLRAQRSVCKTIASR